MVDVEVYFLLADLFLFWYEFDNHSKQFIIAASCCYASLELINHMFIL